jgi:hypothetical protein
MAVGVYVTDDPCTLRGDALIQTLHDLERAQTELDALRITVIRQADDQ